MARNLVLASILALAAITAGCGGGSKSSAPATTSTSSSSGSSSSSSSSSSTTFASVKNCRQLISLGSKLSQALASQSASGVTSLESEAKIIQNAVGAAPAAIRGDIKTLADAYSSYASQLKKAGIKPGSTPTASQIASLVQVLQTFNSPKLKAAVTHIETWANKNCKS